jgi:hypothetical protein
MRSRCPFCQPRDAVEDQEHMVLTLTLGVITMLMNTCTHVVQLDDRACDDTACYMQHEVLTLLPDCITLEVNVS